MSHTLRFRGLAIAGLTLLLVRADAPGQQAPTAPIRYDTSFFGGLSWRNIGPVRGGRSIAVAGTVARPREYYFGATGGGLWKTTDGGLNWRPVTDGQINSSSVGAVAQCEANPDIVYLGMGEVQFRGNIMQGDGLYRSSDAGRTWSHIGLPESQAVGRIRVHPTDCDVVYAAVLGHTYGPNPERGVYRSRDGGGSWERVLFRDERTGAVDLVLDPADPNTLYAGLWQVYRSSWGMYSGGPGSGLFKSTDGGSTWTELTRNAGLPKGVWGKVGVSVSGADPNRVYAIIEADSGGVFRSDDAGLTWTYVNSDRRLRQRAFYYTRIYADPREKDVVYVLNTGFYRSQDGGATFPRQISVPHGDNHDLWIAPDDNQRMINANDGGANVSFNGGQSWTDQDYPTAQLYHITTTNHDPYWACGAQQDNSTACVPSSGWRQMAPLVAVGGGESGYIASDPENPDIFYAGSYGGLLTRFDYATGNSQMINVWPENPMGHSSKDIRERFQWTFPIVFSRTGPKRLYVGSQHLWVTTDEGMSWQKISPDLTRADPKTLGPSGGPITLDQTGVETYATIFTISPSPHDANTIWTGSDDGYVQLTRDHGRTWKNVTPRDLPEFARISLIEVSPHRPATAYVAAKRHQSDDRRPYVYRTDDYGETWVKIVNGIPEHDFVHAVREDIRRPYLLYAGTEHGIHISFDDGLSWQSFRRNLPDVQVPDLIVEDNDLVIATHGRSAWIMESIGPLRQLEPRIAQADVHLFDPADPVRGRGVPLTYYLKAPARTATLEIVDAGGQVIRRFEAAPPGGGGERGGAAGGRGGAGAGEEEAEEGGGGRGGRGGGGGGRLPLRAGNNRFSWDMRLEGATTFPGMILWSAGTQGPMVLPGTYTARLKVDDLPMQTQSFEIRKDPRLTHVTQADLEAQFELAKRIRDRVSEANQAVIDIRDVKRQVTERVGRDASVRQPGETLNGKLSGVEGEIYQVRNQSSQDPLNYPIKLNNKLAALLRAAEGVDGRPPAQVYEVFELLSGQLQTELQRLDVIFTQDVEAFNRLLRSKGLDPVTVPRRTRPVT